MDSFEASFLDDVQLGANDDTSRFLGPTSPWSFSLSPTFYGSNTAESNPFDFSFETNNLGATPSKPAAVDDWDIQTPGATTTGELRRKRAFSSPAVTPGGLGFNLDFPELQSFKRPRLSLDAEVVADESSASASGSTSHFGAETDGSPVSSSVFTPPDSGVPAPSLFPYEKDFSSTAFAEPQFFLHDAESLYQSVLAASTRPSSTSTSTTSLAPMPMPISLLPHTLDQTPTSLPPARSSYEQFVFAAPTTNSLTDGSAVHRSIENVSPFILQLQTERNLMGLAPRTVNAPGSPPSFEPRGGLMTKPKGKPAPLSAKARKALAKKGKKAAIVEEAPEEELDAADEEASRKIFLERNRIAAVKSRQKKKERVNNLESQASDIAAQNHALQADALALREEVMKLRAFLSLHNGCTCDHVAGYLAREQSGGGIPTIDSLSGYTLGLDYTNVPTMGSEDDLYADLHSRASREGSAVSEASSRATTVAPVSRAKAVKKAVVPTAGRTAPASASFAMTKRSGSTAGIDIPVGELIPLRPLPANVA